MKSIFDKKSIINKKNLLFIKKSGQKNLFLDKISKKRSFKEVEIRFLFVCLTLAQVR